MTEQNHESLCVVGLSRVSSTGAVLNGSDFKHCHYVILSIKRARRQFDLGRWWTHPAEELIQISITESQLGEMMTHFNIGEGVLCTLTRFDGKSIPPPPAPEPLRHESDKELRAACEKAVVALDEAEARIAEAAGAPNKGKVAAIGYAVRRVRAAITNSIPFIHRSFDERVEQATALAKIEVDAHIAAAIAQFGSDEIKRRISEGLPKQIEGGRP